MKVFLVGAVTSADSKQLSKYSIYKDTILSVLKNIELSVPDDILNYRINCIKNNSTYSKLDIDKSMVAYDLSLIKQSDLIICDLSTQSNGLGIELGVAFENCVKVIFFSFSWSW